MTDHKNVDYGQRFAKMIIECLMTNPIWFIAQDQAKMADNGFDRWMDGRNEEMSKKGILIILMLALGPFNIFFKELRNEYFSYRDAQYI